MQRWVTSTHSLSVSALLTQCAIVQALLEKLDTLLQVQQAVDTLQPTSPAAAASLAFPVEAPLPGSAGGVGHEQQFQQQQFEVYLKEGEDGQIRFMLSPSKHCRGGEEEADHMPSHLPLQQSQEVQQSGMAVAMGRQWEPEPSRPGALVEGAARGAPIL